MISKWRIAVLAPLAAALFVGASRPSPAQRPVGKRALLVGLNDYSSPYGKVRKDLTVWPNLNGSRDAEHLRTVLRDRWGFADTDILVLKDLAAFRAGKRVPGNATRAGILKAFREHLLGPATVPGDVLFFAFSGHGEQVPDRSGDEVLDRKDEALVPYDYVAGGAANARADVLDDDVRQLINEATARIGQEGNLTLVFDCCHSGTLPRGGTPRMRGRPFDPRYDGEREEAKPRSRAAQGGIRFPGVDPAGSGYQDSGDRATGNYVSIGAAQSHQLAWEMDLPEQGGRLSWYLCRALETLRPGATYRDLFDAVSPRVISGAPAPQMPALEGNFNQELFSGRVKPQPLLPTVTTRGNRAAGILEISAGRLHGITKGSSFSLYPPGADTTDVKNRRAVARVTEVGFSTCKASLDPAQVRAIGADRLPGFRAVLSAANYDNQRLRVLMEGTADLRQKLAEPGVAAAQDSVELIAYTPAPGRARGAAEGAPQHDLYLVRETSGGSRSLSLRRPDGQVVTEQPDSEAGIATLRQRLRRIARRRLLFDLEGGAATATPTIQAQLRLRPVGGAGTMEQGRLVLRTGDLFKFEIENKSNIPVYVYVVNVQPDGSLYPIFPNRDVPDDNRLPARQTVTISADYVIQEPLGADLYRLIATADPIDIAALIFDDEPPTGTTRGARTRSAKSAVQQASPRVSPLARLLLSTQTRTRATGTVPPDYWGTDTVLITSRAR